MKKLALHWKIIIGLVLGIIYALIASSIGLNQFTIDWIDPFGTIFIRLLKFIAVPLVLFSIIACKNEICPYLKIGLHHFINIWYNLHTMTYEEDKYHVK